LIGSDSQACRGKVLQPRQNGFLLSCQASVALMPKSLSSHLFSEQGAASLENKYRNSALAEALKERRSA
jgi:hypothetical protein